MSASALRRTLGLCITVAAAAAAVPAAADAAYVSKSNVSIEGGTADFGAGQHHNGWSAGGDVTWDFSTPNGLLKVSARLQGKLFYDSGSGGCVRLVAIAKNAAGAELARRTVPA